MRSLFAVGDKIGNFGPGVTLCCFVVDDNRPGIIEAKRR